MYLRHRTRRLLIWRKHATRISGPDRLRLPFPDRHIHSTTPDREHVVGSGCCGVVAHGMDAASARVAVCMRKDYGEFWRTCLGPEPGIRERSHHRGLVTSDATIDNNFQCNNELVQATASLETGR